VSGKTMQTLREMLTKDGNEGEYSWDYMDGLDELDSANQNKIKTAITEGKIADEDWNGDPEFNVLGKVGIRARVKKAKAGDVEVSGMIQVIAK
jgi:serine/threonine-protein kinase ATR